MSDTLEIMLALKEAGAVGGMVFDPAGRVLVHTMPGFFPSASLSSAGARIVIFYETITENFEPVSDVVLAFEGYVLLLRRSPEIFLAVVMNESGNREAVKMATNLVFRRLRTSNVTVQTSPRRGVAPALPREVSVRIPPPPRPVSQASTKPGQAKPAALPTKKKKSDIWGD